MVDINNELAKYIQMFGATYNIDNYKYKLNESDLLIKKENIEKDKLNSDLLDVNKKLSKENFEKDKLNRDLVDVNKKLISTIEILQKKVADLEETNKKLEILLRNNGRLNRVIED